MARCLLPHSPILFAIAVSVAGSVGAAQRVRLAADKQPLLPIIVSNDATDRVQQAADTLANYLSRISGARFSVRQGDGTRGIAVGTLDDFPRLAVAPRFDPQDPARREEYLLRSHEHGVQLIGATELAVEHAVWDLLYRLGYRQFFPGEAWEIVPVETELSIEVDSFERPDYLSRRIWYGYSFWDYNRQPYGEWCAKNRCVAGLRVNTGHAYDRVVRANRQAFADHPEYWPLLDGRRQPVRNPKPCLGNPDVRRLFVNYALEQFRKRPELDSISMDPSDGGGWCQCEQCAKLGSVSDQVVTLANEVAAAVDAEYPGKLIGIYAYNFHSTPPTIRVHRSVVVSVATAFIKGGLSLDEIITGWSKREARLGIREYYSVNTWDRDQPGHARGGNLEYLRRTIPEFHSQGVRFMSAESSDNWGPNGLGYYLAAHMLWDVDEARQIEELKEDFLQRAFGPAREPMREFYRQLDGSKPHLVADDQLGRMFRSLAEARKQTKQAPILRRINELALYAHYCSLFHQYSTAKDSDRQAAFEHLIRHAYRMRKTMLVHTKALYRDLVARDKTVSIPDNATWRVPEETNPWKSSRPFDDGEIAALITSGVERHQLVKLDFKPVKYSSNLVPAAEVLNFPDTVPPGQFGPGRGTQTFLTYVRKAPATLTLQVTGGLIAHYRDRGNVKVQLWKIGGESETGERATLVAVDRSVPPDGVERTVKLVAKQTGLHRITVNDGGDRTQITWPADQVITVSSTVNEPINRHYRQWMGYFYVPKGTRLIGLFGGGHGELRDSQNRPHFWLNGRERNFYSVPVPPGEDGKVWKVRYIQGDLRLLTVPPYFAATPRGLLLPQEVVERDRR